MNRESAEKAAREIAWTMFRAPSEQVARMSAYPDCQEKRVMAMADIIERAGREDAGLPLCETTGTPRRACAMDCGTYPGNLGPCETWEKGGNGRCVYCDHGKSCHLTERACGQNKPSSRVEIIQQWTEFRKEQRKRPELDGQPIIEAIVEFVLQRERDCRI